MPAVAPVEAPSETRVSCFLPIARVDEGRREVYAIATSETPVTRAQAGNGVITFEASKRGFERMQRKAADIGAPGGIVRERWHDDGRDVGRCVMWEPLDDQRQIGVAMRISKGAEDTWQKILDGTLRGVSVGGHILEQEQAVARLDNGAERILPRITDIEYDEVVLTGTPSDPAALITRVYRTGEGVSDLVDEAGDLDVARAWSDQARGAAMATRSPNPQHTVNAASEAAIRMHGSRSSRQHAANHAATQTPLPHHDQEDSVDEHTHDGDQSDESGEDIARAATHEPFAGTHSHAHPAFGSQGGDDSHEHEHSHDGDADHRHEHEDMARADLPDKERDKMDASDFAYVDSQGGKHLPIHDEGHIRSALGRFGQTQGMSAEDKAKAAKKIVAAAKAHGIDVAPDSAVGQAAGLKQEDKVERSAADMRDEVRRTFGDHLTSNLTDEDVAKVWRGLDLVQRNKAQLPEPPTPAVKAEGDSVHRDDGMDPDVAAVDAAVDDISTEIETASGGDGDEAGASAESEMTDAQIGQQAIALVDKLLARESQELAAGDSHDACDVQNLLWIRDCLHHFVKGELIEALEMARTARETVERLTADVRAFKSLAASAVKRTTDLSKRMEALEAEAAEVKRAEPPLKADVAQLQADMSKAVKRITALEDSPAPSGLVTRAPVIALEKTLAGELPSASTPTDAHRVLENLKQSYIAAGRADLARAVDEQITREAFAAAHANPQSLPPRRVA